MITPEFQRLYRQLNTAQKQAVDTVEGAVMVVAGPGTGKTTVLTLRIAKILLETQVNPENILALTFTESAASEMRKRLLSIIGHDAYRVEITTFHSFCNNFIKHNQDEFANIISAENINEIEQLEIIESIMSELSLSILRPLGDLTYYVKPVMSSINELKRENVSPEDFKVALNSYEKEIMSSDDLYHEKGAYKGKMKSEYQKALASIEKNKELLSVYETYKEKMLQYKKYDYNDMLLEVIRKLEEHPYLLQYLQEKFHYFLVDEHQDTNASQNKIVEMLAGFFENPNLFIVGDEKQAIFRFQGASLENFLYFKKKYPMAVMINLSENYRSTQTILNATHSLIQHNNPYNALLSEKNRLIKQAKNKEEKICVVPLSSSRNEQIWVVEKVKELKSHTPLEEIAILGRNNKDLDAITSLFEREKIPFTLQADSNILEDNSVQKFILILKAIHSPLNTYVNRILLFDIFNIEPIDAFKIVRNSYERKLDIWVMLTDNKIIAELNLKDVKKVLSFVDLFMDAKNGFLRKSADLRMDELFVDVMNDSGFLKSILSKQNAQDILSKITRLYDEVKDEVRKNHSFSLAEFLKYIELLEDHKVALKDKTVVAPKGYLRLMTVHKSKGLEFDYVFVINCFDGHWGNMSKRGNLFSIPWHHLQIVNTKIATDNGNEDERRLFYVALTRARKNIFLSYSTVSDDGKNQLPSRFLSEISEEFKKDIDVKEFEELHNSQKELVFKESTDFSNQKIFTREYISQIFIKNGLSVSALNNYLECPWKYFFVNLLRVPEKIDDAGLFGNAVHAALNQYIIALKKGNVTREYLLQRFEEELKLQSVTSSEYERFLERGKSALINFYNSAIVNWTRDMESEVDIKGIRINDELFLNGKIDMILPQSKTGMVDVYDFKTGKPKSRNQIEGNVKNGDGNYKRQLVFYKLLLDRYKNGFFKMQNGIIEFVEPSEKGDHKFEVFDISKSDSEELLTKVITIGNEITNLAFWDNYCEKKDCQYCNLRKSMAN